jgi:uncharacterized protein YjdB
MPSIATITDAGLVTGVSAGSVRFIFKDNVTGCKSDSTKLIKINALPAINLLGPNSICVDGTSKVAPTNGTWKSSNSNFLEVDNTGKVFGHGPGTFSLKYTSAFTGCTSKDSIVITVKPNPVVVLNDHDICIGESITLVSPSAGSWTALNKTIASVSTTGLVMGLSPGQARFLFTAANGCSASNDIPLIVNSNPIPTLGVGELCLGNTANASPSFGGIWTSLKPTVASITNSGKITGLSAGSTFFVYQDTITGCKSDTTLNITVAPKINLSIVGPSTICLGYHTQLSPSYGGLWISSDPSVAEVSNIGMVTGLAPGKVTFEYKENGTGCSSKLDVDAVTVKNCLDPDFNATFQDVVLNGNIRTNDDIPAGTTYGNFVKTIKKPTGSLPSLTINANGTYTFVSDLEGKYIYEVPICMSPFLVGCKHSLLEITVLDKTSIANKPIANIDIASSYYVSNIAPGQMINIKSLANDKCNTGITCPLEKTAMTITIMPKKGVAVPNADGTFNYTPYVGVSGSDTFEYKVCLIAEPTNCSISKQIIVINKPSALNSTVGADDFGIINEGEVMNINVLTNDMDAEGDIQSISPQGSATTPITIPQGSYYLLANGNFVFTPASKFSGPVDVVYSICDNNAASVCDNATIHILVKNDFDVKVRVYLEGPLTGVNINTPRPLMRDDLRESPWTGKRDIPNKDIYKFPTKYVDVRNKYQHVACGLLSRFDAVIDTLKVFGDTSNNAIVDWVFVQIRSKQDPRNVIATRSGLLQRDGDIVDLDGVSDLIFPGVFVDSFYLSVKHRSHLGVMSMKLGNGQAVDFTTPTTKVFDYGISLEAAFNYTNLAQNTYGEFKAMWAGDFNSDGKVKFAGANDDLGMIFDDVLFNSPTNSAGTSNYNNTFGYYQGDFNMDGKVKFDNPNDDKNLLYFLVLNYPLNANSFSNFDKILQQIPE